MGRKKPILCLFAVIGVLFGIIALFVYRSVRHERLNQDLMEAISRDRYDYALLLLKQGADATAPIYHETDEGIFDKIRRTFGWPAERDSNESADTRREIPLEVLYGFGGLYGQRQAPGSELDNSSFQQFAVALLEEGSPTDILPTPAGNLVNTVVRLHHHTVLPVLLRVHPDMLDQTGQALIDADAVDAAVLLAHGTNIEAVQRYTGRTGVFGANAAKLELLQSHGARLNVVSVLGDTPLMEACAHGDAGAVDFLIKRGAIVGANNRDGFTPMLWARQGCRLETIKKLAASGANVHDRNNAGATLLMMAVTNSDARVVPWLIQQGVDVNFRDRKSRTALRLAYEYANRIGRMGGGMSSEEEMTRSFGHYISVVKLLRRHGAE